MVNALLVPGSRPELSPIHLPQVRGRERVDEDHLARMLVGLQPVAHKRLELLPKIISTLAGDDVGVRLHQPAGVGHAHHRHLRYRRMEQQTAFNFGG